MNVIWYDAYTSKIIQTYIYIYIYIYITAYYIEVIPNVTIKVYVLYTV